MRSYAKLITRNLSCAISCVISHKPQALWFSYIIAYLDEQDSSVYSFQDLTISATQYGINFISKNTMRLNISSSEWQLGRKSVALMTEEDRLELTEQQSSTEEPRMLFNCKEDHLFKSNEKKFRAKKTDGSIWSMQYKKKPQKSKFDHIRTSYHLTTTGLLLYNYFYLWF